MQYYHNVQRPRCLQNFVLQYLTVLYLIDSYLNAYSKFVYCFYMVLVTKIRNLHAKKCYLKIYVLMKDVLCDSWRVCDGDDGVQMLTVLRDVVVIPLDQDLL